MTCTLEVPGGKVFAKPLAMAQLIKELGLTPVEAVVRNTLLPEVVETAVPQTIPQPAPQELPVLELNVGMKGFRKEIYHSHKVAAEIDGVAATFKPNWVAFTEYVYTLAYQKLGREELLKLNIDDGKRRAKDLVVNLGVVEPGKRKLICNGMFLMRSPSAEEACYIADDLLKRIGKTAVVTFAWYGGKNKDRKGKITLGV